MFSPKILIAAVLVALAVAASATATPDFDLTLPSRDLFNQYLAHFQPSFTSPKDKLHKFNVFTQNVKKIQELNAAARKAGRNTEFGLNQFSLMSEAEFTAKYLNKVMPSFPNLTQARRATAAEIASLPTSFDWRTANPPIVTKVKNQGECGDCWAFSTTGNVEGVWAKAGNKLVSLSEQNLCDCSTQNDGCNGGEMTLAFEYIIKQGGIDSEASYPYKGVQGRCKFERANVAAKISNWEAVQKDVTEMKTYLVSHSPIAIAVDATSWQNYRRGVLSSHCGTALDHGVLLVGYGVESSSNTPFWIIKNSWAESWGMQGYIEVEITDDLCGIQKQPVSAIA